MGQECKVEGCDSPATLEVILYDFYSSLSGAKIFFEQDKTCPYICDQHAIENEKKAEGERKPRGHVSYPYTNQHGAQGFTIYRRIEA
jgi:hypothetical protein